MMGYIKQDVGTYVLVLPDQCVGFGGVLPPEGTRLNFDVVIDPTLGMLKAENVQPEITQSGMGPLQHNMGALASLQAPQSQLLSAANLSSQLAPFNPLSTITANSAALATSLVPSVPAQPAGAPVRMYSEGRRSGIFIKQNGNFGFIKQDDEGAPDMFVMPRACAAFGEQFPIAGTRVVFEVVTSDRTGKPRAENCRPGYSGTMHHVKGTFGFIKQDSGEDDMFVMPRCCPYFNDEFPPIGTRVVYEVVSSDKTGRPRAEDVQPMHKQAAAANLDVLQLEQAAGILGLQAGMLKLEDSSKGAVSSAAGAGVGQAALLDAQPNVAVDSVPSGESFHALVPPFAFPDDEPDAKRRKTLE